MGFSSLPFTANLVPEWPAVLISTDDFLRLKRGFATADGRRLSRRDEKPSRGRRPRLQLAMEDPFNIEVQAGPGRPLDPPSQS